MSSVCTACLAGVSSVSRLQSLYHCKWPDGVAQFKQLQSTGRNHTNHTERSILTYTLTFHQILQFSIRDLGRSPQMAGKTIVNSLA